MKVAIKVSTTKSMWVPPFSKETETEDLKVKTGNEFHTDKLTKQKVFILLDANSNYIVLGYNSTFHLKKNVGEVEELIYQGKKALKLHLGKTVSFSHMWGDMGITKTITYTSPVGEEPVESKQAEENVDEEENIEEPQE